MSNVDPSPQRSLRKEITGILVFKLVIILLAGFTVFGVHHRLHVDKEAMTNKLLENNVPSPLPPVR